MKIRSLHFYNWENLKNRPCIKYLFAPLYIYIYIYIHSQKDKTLMWNNFVSCTIKMHAVEGF